MNLRAENEVIQVTAHVAHVFEGALVTNRYALAAAEPGDIIRQQGHAFEEKRVHGRIFFQHLGERLVDKQGAGTGDVMGVAIAGAGRRRCGGGAGRKRDRWTMLVRAGEVEDGWVGIIAMREGDFCRKTDGEIVRYENENVGDVGERSGYDLGIQRWG